MANDVDVEYEFPVVYVELKLSFWREPSIKLDSKRRTNIKSDVDPLHTCYTLGVCKISVGNSLTCKFLTGNFKIG